MFSVFPSPTVCTEHLQQTNPFKLSYQYFMPVFLTTESSPETLMVTPLRVLFWWSWLCLKNSWIIKQSCKQKILWNLEALFYLSSTNAHFCMLAFYVTALCKSYLKQTLNTTGKLMEFFFFFFLGQIAFCVVWNNMLLRNFTIRVSRKLWNATTKSFYISFRMS